MPRWFFIVVALFGLAALASYALTFDDPIGLLMSKLGEGGMWTAIVGFVVLAVVLGYWPRNADGTLRPPRK